MNQIYQLFERFTTQESFIRHQGVFTWKTIKSLLALTERKLDTLGERTVIRGKVFHAVTEALQNAVKHRHGSLGVCPPSIFMFGREKKKYAILTGNAIMKSGRGSLQKKLTHLNSLNKVDLRNSYLHHLQHGWISEKGGAGLGLTRLARISAAKLKFQFYEIDRAYSYFILELRVG